MRRWSILVIISSMAQAFSAALAQDPCRPEDRRLVPTALPGTAGLSPVWNVHIDAGAAERLLEGVGVAG
jgi:hypothetical protein